MSNPTAPLSTDRCVVFICHWHQAGPGRMINTHLRLRDKPLLQRLYTPSFSLYLSCVLRNGATKRENTEMWLVCRELPRQYILCKSPGGRKSYLQIFLKGNFFRVLLWQNNLFPLFFSIKLFHSSPLIFSSISSNNLDIIWILTAGTKARLPAVFPFTYFSPSSSAFWRGLPWVPLFQVSLTLAAF